MSQSQIDFIHIFVRPPGDLIYFLVVVALSQAAFFMALGHRLRHPTERSARRYTLATLGVVATWAFLMVGALFALLTGQDSVAILPPLEHAAQVSSILLIGWAFLTADHDLWPRASNLTLLGLMVLVIAAYMFTGLQWPGLVASEDFLQTGYGVAWAFIPAALSILGIVLIVAYFRVISDAPLKLLFFAVLLMGYGLTLTEMMQGSLVGDYAGAVRIAFLAALPILLAVIYRLVLSYFEAEVLSHSQQIGVLTTREIPQIPVTAPLRQLDDSAPYVPAAPDALATASDRESVQLMRALGLILEGARPENIPEKIVSAALQVLQADVGVLLAVQGANYADIVTGYDRVKQRHIAGMPVNLDTQPTLVNAIERRLQRPLYPDRNADELNDLYTRFDMDQVGPTYFQPLASGKELLGVLVIGLPYASRELDEQAQELLKGTAIIAANLLALSRAAEDERARAEEQLIQAMVQGAPAEQLADEGMLSAWQEMQVALEAAREQITGLTRQVTALKVELDYERGRMADVLGDTDEGISISQRIITLSEEQQRLLEERDRLSARLREMETALAGATGSDNEGVFKTMIDVLNREKDELAAQKASLEAQLQELRSSRTAPMPHVVQEMLDRMSREKARLEVERDALSSKVQDIEAQLNALGIEEGASGVAQLIGKLYEERAALQVKNDVLQRERDALLSERARFENRIEHEEAREKQLQALQTELKNVAADREALMKQRDKLRGERDELAEKLDGLKEQRARLTAQVSAFEQELAEAHDIQTQLRQQIQQLADERTELGGLRDRLNAERQALETERDQLMARADGDRERLQQLGVDGVGSLARIIEEVSSQRDQLERELNEALTRLAALENQLEVMQMRAYAQEDSVPRLDNPQLLTSMVQELRTPMTSIIGYVDLLLGESAGILGEMQRKFLQRVSANVTRLAAMLEDLVRVTMLDSGQFQLMPEPVDVIGVIEDAITMASEQLREKGLTVHLNLDDDVPPVYADNDGVAQIIGQMLTNAYLASPPGSEIFVAARRQAVPMNGTGEPVDSLYVSVEDRGGGIALEDQLRVFNRKYKAENPLIQGLGDTGVGMSIARALVEAHGGKIWLETRDQVGTVFCFAIPLATALEPQGQ